MEADLDGVGPHGQDLVSHVVGPHGVAATDDPARQALIERLVHDLGVVALSRPTP